MAIRPLHPLDIARYTLRGGPGRGNCAFTLDTLYREPQTRISLIETAGLSLSLQGRGICSWTRTQGTQVMDIVAARPRSGPTTWEVAHLLLASHDDPGCADLLAKVCQEVARKGGERIFVRLQNADPMVDVARVCSFAPCTHELLYKGLSRSTPSARPISLRKKRPADEYGMFQLYNAATPSETRLALGMTFSQWRSSQESSHGRRREFVLERDGRIRSWVRIIQRPGRGKLTIMVHPEDETNVAALMDYGLARMAGTKTVYCLVSEHQVLLQRLLDQKGFEMVSEYVTLVKSMVTPARQEKTRQAATAAPG